MIQKKKRILGVGNSFTQNATNYKEKESFMAAQTDIKTNPILGSVKFPKEWTIFAAFESATKVLSGDQVKEIPEKLTIGGITRKAKKVKPSNNQYDFRLFFDDPPYDSVQTAYAFVELNSKDEQEVTLGFGVDWTMKIWLNGEVILDALLDGNLVTPPAINNFTINVKLKKGRNVLAAVMMNGKASALLAMGGPEELRKGNFESILPKPEKLSAQNISKLYPPAKDAPIKWIPPKTFNLDSPDLGFPKLKKAEHMELLHAKKSNAPLDEGGSGKYRSLQHGSWNHNNKIATFKDRLIAIWDNHSLDENGPGSRVIAKVGKITNPETGEIDWGGEETFAELAPPAVPVRRRKIHCDDDAVRSVMATGTFYEIDGRLIFCGRLTALYGITTNAPKYNYKKTKVLIDDGEFFFGPVPQASVNKAFMNWDLGMNFYQEWDVVDDRLQPVTPIYKENEMSKVLEITSKITLPLEPLIEPYKSAALLKAAPEDLQDLINNGKRKSFTSSPKYAPQTAHLTEDGTNGLLHSSEFVRPDGVYVAVRENQKPKVSPVYYAAVKPDKESVYPPAKRTNLYGAVNPASGELEDGRVFIVGNSPNRRTMFLYLSEDGKVFDKSWFLLHKKLGDFTPGIMKSQGGPGAGPQYFTTAVIGKSLWIIYSISKEHIGATRVPIEALR